MSLSVDDFNAFHQAVHHSDPFKWQSLLLRKIVSDHTWPRVSTCPPGQARQPALTLPCLRWHLTLPHLLRSAGVLAGSQ